MFFFGNSNHMCAFVPWWRLLNEKGTFAMRKRIPYLFIAVLIAFPIWTHAAQEVTKVGDAFPDLTLQVPESASQREYLGISGDKTFKLSQIKAQVLIIEIFSMYCPHCQREARDINRLHEMIENDPALKGKTKMIGIGAGNTPFEVNVFRKKYDVPFPLFPDADFSLYNRLGKVRTPYFFCIRLTPDGDFRVFYTKLGTLDGPEQFLKDVVSKSKKGRNQ